MYQKYEGFAKQKLFFKNGQMRGEVIRDYRHEVFDHFGVVEANVNTLMIFNFVNLMITLQMLLKK